MIDLICFSRTNEAEYYRDYLRLKELDAAVHALRDQQEFFGFRRRNTEHYAEPARLVAGLKEEPAEVGDFVWVKGDICRVKEVRKSKYGYTNYLVQYVEPPPIPEIKEDYFAGGEIRLVAKKSYGEKALRRLQTEPTIDENARRYFSKISLEKREQIIGEAVAKLWRLQQKMLADARAKRS